MKQRFFTRIIALVWLTLVAYGVFLRRWHLRWGATPVEAQRPIAGDGVIPHPELEATRAVSILAPPEQVWPWLVQMGYGRAGWYSYDAIDNSGIPSADRVVPEFQDLGVGDFMPLDASGAGFIVTEMDPPRSLVLSVPEMAVFGATGRVVVGLVLEPVGPRTTRLVCRIRAEFGRNVRSRLYYAIFEPGDFVMMRKMLLGIKARAERTARESAPHAA
jgi:hypothetical protein